MRDCAKKCCMMKKCCEESECRLHLDYPTDLNCTLVAIDKYGPMTLEEIGKRHHFSTVRAKQIVDLALVKLKKTFDKENTI